MLDPKLIKVSTTLSRTVWDRHNIEEAAYREYRRFDRVLGANKKQLAQIVFPRRLDFSSAIKAEETFQPL